MTFVITEPCIDTMDQSCVDVCPVDCIHFEEGQDRMLYIDPAECIDCGACQPACPVSAIFPEGDVPANQEHFTEINSLWYQDPDAAREKVGGGGGAAAPAAEPAAPAAQEAESEAPAAEEEPAPAAEAQQPAEAPASSPAPAAKGPQQTAPPPPGRPRKRRSISGFKIGESGVEGKCAICGQYVIKGGVRFRRKSVLCPEHAAKRERAQNPYGLPAGRR